MLKIASQISCGDVTYSIGEIVNIIIITFMLQMVTRFIVVIT